MDKYKGQRKRKDSMQNVVEGYFRREIDICTAVRKQRQDNQSSARGEASPHPRGVISDPTAMAAIRNLTEIQSITLSDGTVILHPERWLQVIRATYDNQDKLGKKVLKMRFWYGWTYAKTHMTLHISQAHYYVIMDRAMGFAVAAACQLGLVKVITPE